MNRIHELDALRGMALFGILLVNIFVFHAPIFYYGEFYGAFEGLQALAVEMVVDFAAGKFLFLFAFLFGYGIVLQQRSHATSFAPYFVKRMGVLLLFGVAHLLFFWLGDILASYALLGLLAVPLLRLPTRGILVLGLVFLFFRPLYYAGVLAFDWPTVSMGRPATLEQFMAVFRHGSYLEVFQLRMQELWAFTPENLVWYIPKTFGLFLVGMSAARFSLVQHIREKVARYFAITVVLVVISVLWLYCRTPLFEAVDLKTEPHWRPVFIGLNALFETTLGVGYLLGASLLFQRHGWLTRLLANAGRLALTNYFLQSTICVLLFYSYGLGLYGTLRPTDLVLLTMGTFGFNVLFSYAWLRRYQSGPMEWLWRRWIGKV